MKKIFFIFFILAHWFYCNAQDWDKIDSLVLVQRNKADIVLSHFDTIQGKKLLYSIQDKNYYIIIQKDNEYKEFYVTIDSICNIINLKEVENSNELKIKQTKYSNREKRKIVKQIQQDIKIINEAFDLNQYHIGYITRLGNTKWTAGVPSYFVITDVDGRRYGEYSLSSLTLPIPIDTNLYIYLIKSLSEQSK
jgi:hypothetical protein